MLHSFPGRVTHLFPRTCGERRPTWPSSKKRSQPTGFLVNEKFFTKKRGWSPDSIEGEGKNGAPGDSSRDLFGMVKTWPFQGVKWPPTRGWKGHFESPGCFFFLKGEGGSIWCKETHAWTKYTHYGISMNLIISKMNWTEIPMDETFRVYPGANGKVVVSFA